MEKESFEDMPLITGLLTNLGFYILMLAGFVSQLFVKQNVETEKNRDVSLSTVSTVVVSSYESGNFRRDTFLSITNSNSSTSDMFTGGFVIASIDQ